VVPGLRPAYTLRLTDRWPVPDVLYADRYGLRVVCLRLGGVQDRPLARSWLPGWLSGPDVVRFVGAALPADVRFGVYHGVSANSARLRRTDRTREDLGYRPLDNCPPGCRTEPARVSASST
jgi:hypothetical protein